MPATERSKPSDLAAAHHRVRLRERVEICTALRRKPTAAAGGGAFAAALLLGEEAAAELALIPDTLELGRRDTRLLAGAVVSPDSSGSTLRQLIDEYRNGRTLDLFTASPTELLACCAARAGLP